MQWCDYVDDFYQYKGYNQSEYIYDGQRVELCCERCLVEDCNYDGVENVVYIVNCENVQCVVDFQYVVDYVYGFLVENVSNCIDDQCFNWINKV